ncbi:hypothetical protein GCM10010411_08080 [Actinomadura fulvescens]|uniref:Uncharacterized protein n=1 Tax=Actinomadura fulvescens TaxID=46160 RepID=A0ABP6BMN0_9ACTN
MLPGELGALAALELGEPAERRRNLGGGEGADQLGGGLQHALADRLGKRTGQALGFRSGAAVDDPLLPVPVSTPFA